MIEEKLTIEEALAIADKLVYDEIGRYLTSTEVEIFRNIWLLNEKYPEIAQKCGLSEVRIRRIASDLWNLLSKKFEEKVEKKNLKSVFQRKGKITNQKINQACFDTETKETSFSLVNSLSNNLQKSIELRTSGQVGVPAYQSDAKQVSQVKSDQFHDFYIIQNTQELIQANISIVENAEVKLLTTGSRTRDPAYLKTIEEKLSSSPHLIYYRVLLGYPHHSIFKEHLINLLKIRSPLSENYHYQTLYLGLFNDHFYDTEKFICANESKVIIILPSVNGVGKYDTALISTNQQFVNNMIRYVQELYSASEPYETIQKIQTLDIIRKPDVPKRGT